MTQKGYIDPIGLACIEGAIAEGFQGFDYKQIGGKVVCISPFAFTYGLVVGVDVWGHERRYCYEHREDAQAALETYTDPTVHPDGPWIKCKGSLEGQPVDMLNPKCA